MKKITLQTLGNMKQAGEKITCLTACDYTHAFIASTSNIDIILVGDSLGMVAQGHETTAQVTIDQMVYHTQCVHRGNQGSFLMADLPYMSYATTEQTFTNATKLMQAGADMVKLEGGSWLCDTVKRLSERGIPTCLHLGLTPQSVAIFGGFKVQGRTQEAANRLINDARNLQQAGANLLVLECIPAILAREISQEVQIPTIGIGAGKDTDGQVLVFYDMLNMTPGHRPRFIKNFMLETSSPQEAVALYAKEVKAGYFPGEEHTYTAKGINK